MQNTLNTLQRDKDITWFTQTMGYVHKEIVRLLLQSRKMKGYNLQQNYGTSSPHFHSLSQTIIEIVYNAIMPYKTMLQCFLL